MFVRIVLMAVLGPGLTIAQGRGVVRGVVKTADGKPWAKAEVTLIAMPSQDGDVYDSVTVVSDAKGRVRARLIKGIEYRACALMVLGAGRYRTSGIVRCVAGKRLDLKAIDDVQLRVRLRVPPGSGGSRVAFRRGSAWGRVIELRPDANGEVLLPPLAGGQTHVELLDAAGLPKSWAFVKTGEKARKKSTPRDLTVLEPQTGVVMLFRVMADGKPLEGVRAFEAHATRSIRGISDAQGWMRYVYTTSNPTLNRWHALRLVFDKPGYALTEMPQVFVVHAKGGGAGQGLFAGGLALLD